MSQMFAALHHPFGLGDRDEGSDSVYAFGVSADKQKLIDAVKAKMEDGGMVDIEVVEDGDEIHILGGFGNDIDEDELDEDADEDGEEDELDDFRDEPAVYYVIKAVDLF